MKLARRAGSKYGVDAWLSLVFCFGESLHLVVSKNNGTPKSSILIGLSIINHPFWDNPIFGNTHVVSSYTTIQYNSRFKSDFFNHKIFLNISQENGIH